MHAVLRRAVVAAAALACLAFTFPAASIPASVATGPMHEHLNSSDGGTCPTYGDLEICTGQVPSFDGVELDVDLTKPTNGRAGAHPLIVMLHGFGNDKHEWESLTDEGDGADKWHWNSHWFAEHGYYVLTYTARGFESQDDGEAYTPDTPPGTSESLPSGTLHLKSREFEIRDTQWLAALAAASFDIDPTAIAVTGGSYGGGESWLQASQPTWTFPNELDASLPVLELQVAVPKYPWTDLGYSLAPNGRPGGPDGSIHEASAGRPDSDTGDGYPLGALKESYVTGLYALGNTDGTFEAGTTTTPSEEGPIDVHVWLARGQAGEPYDVAGVEDPVVAQLRRGLTEYRSAYYQQDAWAAQVGDREVAVFSIQGWTDDLFTAVESLRMFRYLKRLDPMWPVEVALGDVGHARAGNPPKTWHRLNGQAWRFLSAHIEGSHRQVTGISTEPTTCTDGDLDDQPARQLSARSPEELSRGSLTVRYASGDTQTNATGLTDPNGPATDPVLGGVVAGQPAACRTSPGPSTDGYTAVSEPLTDPAEYVGLGTVTVPYTLTGTSATLSARVWDVAPDGETHLVTRGTYRFSVPAYDTPSGEIALPLFGNHWRLEPGHRIRLDLVQADAPTLRPASAPSSITFEAPTLTLPIRHAGEVALAGT